MEKVTDRGSGYVGDGWWLSTNCAGVTRTYRYGYAQVGFKVVLLLTGRL